MLLLFIKESLNSYMYIFCFLRHVVIKGKMYDELGTVLIMHIEESLLVWGDSDCRRRKLLGFNSN